LRLLAGSTGGDARSWRRFTVFYAIVRIVRTHCSVGETPGDDVSLYDRISKFGRRERDALIVCGTPL